MPPELTDFGYDSSREKDHPLLDPVVPPDLASRALVNPNVLPPVGEQGTSQHPGSPGTCCAWASTYGLASWYCSYYNSGNPAVSSMQASPASIYIAVVQGYNYSCPTGANCTCPGSSYADYLNVLKAGGTPSMEAAPYYPDCDTLWSNYGAQDIAPNPDFQISTWAAFLSTNMNGIKALISQDHPVAFATALYTDWNKYSGEYIPSGQNLPVPYIGNNVLSGAKHCMLIIGYDDNLGGGAFLVQNSQGTVWGTTPEGTSGTGNCGYIWISYGTFSKLAERQVFYVPPQNAG